MLLSGDALWELDNTESQNNGLTNTRWKGNTIRFTWLLIPRWHTQQADKSHVALYKETRALPTNRMTYHLTDPNNYPPIFPGSNEYRKMDREELNEILLHAVPNS